MDTEIISRTRLYKKLNTFLNLITASMIAVIVVYVFVQETRYCVTNGDTESGVELDNFIVVFFYLLGFEFLIVGIVMVLSIRRYFPEFYKDYGCLLVVASLLLSLPMFIRSLDT